MAERKKETKTRSTRSRTGAGGSAGAGSGRAAKKVVQDMVPSASKHRSVHEERTTDFEEVVQPVPHHAPRRVTRRTATRKITEKVKEDKVEPSLEEVIGLHNVEGRKETEAERSLEGIPEVIPEAPPEETIEDYGQRVPIHVTTFESQSISSDDIPRSKVPNLPSSHIHIPPHEHQKYVKEKNKKARRSWFFMTFIMLVLCLGLIAAALSLVFSKGTIIINPKTIAVTVDTTLIAQKEAQDNSSNTSSNPSLVYGLAYKEIDLKDEAQATVPATLGASVTRKATGKVTIYNDFSQAPQKLVATSRLINAKGQIYRLVNTVTVPGQKATADGFVPGTLDVDVIADAAGSEYNLAISELAGDFKFMGYADSPKYTKIYGRQKTDFTGGNIGKQIIPDKEAIAQAETALKQELLTKLKGQAKALVPKGYVLFDNAYEISYSPIQTTTDGVSQPNTAIVTLKGNYKGYVFETDALVRAFAKDQIIQFPENSYRLEDVDTLAFDFISPTAAGSRPKNPTDIKFKLTGNMKIVGIIPEEQLRKELAGVRVTDSVLIIKKYSVIGKAYAKIFPVWMRSLPNSPDRIIIQVEE